MDKVTSTSHQANTDTIYFDIASLHQLRPEIESSLSDIERNVSDFIDDKTTAPALADAVDELAQIKAVLKLIRLNGSSELSTALIDALNQLCDTADNTQYELIFAVSEGIMLLGRYIEFVLLRENIQPKLLLTNINLIRKELKQPLLGESYFDNLTDISKLEAGHKSSFQPINKLGSASKFLQKTFRIGLNTALSIKESKATPAQLKSLQLLQVACQHVQERLGSVFWETALAAVLNIENALPLTPSRKRALIYIEQQFSDQSAQVDKERFADVISMAASRDHEMAERIRNELEISVPADKEFNTMARFMYGPNRDVVDTVNALIQEEISQAKDHVDSAARSETFNPDDFREIAIDMRDLALRLHMLGLKTAAAKVMKEAKAVSQWKHASPEQFSALLSALLYAENSSILMAKSHTPGAISLPLNNTSISLHQLDTAFSELIKESRNTLANAERSVTSFMSAPEKDILHLNNLPAMLSSVGGAMLFVDVPKGYKLLKRASMYVADLLKNPSAITEPVLCKIADIIMAADYYLESVEVNKPSGDQPLAIGARSLKQLLAA